MKSFSLTLLVSLLAQALVPASALPARPDPSPVIKDRGISPTVAISPSNTVVGLAVGKVEKFAGIRFADPPTGSRRLKPPQKLSTNLGNAYDAIQPAAACPQMLVSSGSNQSVLLEAFGDLLNTPLFQVATNQQEDCLTVSIIRPAGVKAGAKLPVLFWIFGGAFELGWSAMYDGSSLVDQAVSQNQPFIFVAVNYRVAGFGFMPGKEILADGSANLGLLDQRMGLEWVADHIEAFGGDPKKVTIWGESAGAISVLDQMVLYGGDITYNGSPLFRGAIMNSGSIVPADPVDCPKGQIVYDSVVKAAGCTAASDTLECLREAPYATFLNAVDSVPGFLGYQSVDLSYIPRPDGTALPDSPDVLVSSGRYAAVPMIIGDQEDEGTLFALFTNTVNTNDELVKYLNGNLFQDATTAQIEGLLATYPQSVTAGSPFNTGLLNELYPQYKRIAAVLGDAVFTLSRRIFLDVAHRANPNVPSWSYLSSYNFGTPTLGTFHASDLLQTFFGIYDNYAARSTRTYYFNFLTNLDPNVGYKGYPNWPKWEDVGNGHQLVHFLANSQGYLSDDFRNDSYNYLRENAAYFRA